MTTPQIEAARSLYHEAKSLLDEWDGKPMPADVQQRYDTLMDEMEAKRDSAVRERKLRALATDLEQVDRPAVGGRPGTGAKANAYEIGSRSTLGGNAEQYLSRDTDPVQVKAFRTYCQYGMNHLTETQLKALQIGDDTQGGYLTVPESFRREIIVAVKDFTPMRDLATMIPLNDAESIGVPTLDTDLGDADWTAEIATVAEDTALRVGKRSLRPHQLTKLVTASNPLLRSTALVDPESFLRDRIAYRFGVTQEKAFCTGTGSQQALGVFTASTDGISTSRDVTVTTSSALDADLLIEAKYTLKSQYHSRARWYLHRDMLRRIRQIKDGNGQYLLQPGLQADLVPTILDLPYTLSEYAPNTFTTGNYVAAIGDFSKYWIVEKQAMSIQRLLELYALSNRTGFLARMEIDGAPVLEEAFVRCKW